MKLATLPVLGLIALASLSHADGYLGAEIGAFFPADAGLRNVLGNSWVSFGVGRVNMSEYAGKTLRPSWNIISGSKNGSKVFMFSYTYGYVYPLAQQGSGVVPYYALRGGLSYIDYAVQVNALNRLSGKAFGYDFNTEVGVLIGDKLTLAARYDFFSAHDGFKFDGLSVSLKYGLYKF